MYKRRSHYAYKSFYASWPNSIALHIDWEYQVYKKDYPEQCYRNESDFNVLTHAHRLILPVMWPWFVDDFTVPLFLFGRKAVDDWSESFLME